ncbi:MAG TPA: 16S rRNA (cytidine(1402)-2'-O)-methyltransferase [Solirubrobacteraceae bacterium]|jgi:16S rRNA (cytidine1402-2'-O)-methyltransferase|nr:16S rRNA (cytidine(1402)-2'-O)-methyltransferase [Solirubrobacteraceae bacterium]
MRGAEEAVASDLAAPSSGRLIVCPTPIGNLGDITLRGLDALRTADVIACEDTRRTRVLLDRYEIAGKLVSFHEHNEDARAAQLLGRIEEGEVVVLVSDAGMPLVSDPGYALVRACVERGLPVEVLPGASSVTTAIVASALPGERWRFVGFLPRRGAASKRAELTRVLGETPETLVAFESPGRLAATLDVLAALDPERPVAVCRELTKLHEEVRRGPAATLAAHYREHPPRGEIVLVIGARPPARPLSPQGHAGGEEALTALRALVEAGARPRPAAAAIAKLMGGSANELYRALLLR